MNLISPLGLGHHELEASIMDGSNLKCGAISLVKSLQNPIKAARLVMENTRHNYLAGEAAESFARSQGMKYVPNDFFTTDSRYQQLLAAKAENKSLTDHDGDAKGLHSYQLPTPFINPLPGHSSNYSTRDGGVCVHV